MNSLINKFKSKNNIFALIDDYTLENNQKLIKYIKKNPASVYDMNNDGLYVYSYATLKGINCLKDVHESFIYIKKKLLFDGLKIKIDTPPYELETFSNKNRPIHYAVEKNLVDQVEYLIKEIGVNINHQNSDGNTPLHIACKFGNRTLVELLLTDKKINLNILNNDLNVPLYIAAINKYAKITELLLSKGASFKIIKKGSKKNFEFDVYSDIKKKKDKYPNIMKLFNKYKKLRREESKFKYIKEEYKYVCDSLKNNMDSEAIEMLAEKLGIKSIDKYTKTELCKKMAERIVIYAQNPEIIEDI